MNRVSLAALTTAFALLVSLPARPALAADDPAALMAEHAAYVGWHAGDGVVKTLRATGRTTRDGKARGTFTSLRYGIAYREQYLNSEGLRYDLGFTGSVPWTSSANGFTIRPLGEAVRAMFATDALFAETTATPEFSPALHGNEKVDGVECAVVRLTSQTAFPIDVYIDPATGAYRRAVVDPDGKYEVSYDGLAYTEVGGKRFLSEWHHGDSKTRFAYTNIVPNAPLDPDELRPPKQVASWTFGDAPAKIEYSDQPAPRVYVDVVMNGVNGKFILDTGSAGTAVVDSFARRAGAKRFTTTTIGGIGDDTAKANVFRVDSLQVGGSTLHDLIITSGLDEEDFQREGAVGIIGFDLFAASIADLNFDTKTLRLVDPAKVQPEGSAGLVVRVDLSDGHIRTPMRLDDKFDVIATLDSGNPADVLFSRDLIKRNHLDFVSSSTRYGYGIGGSEIEHCGKLKSLALGPVRYTTPVACDSPSFTRNEVLVGLDFMRAFNYIFAYPDATIVMIPRKNY